MASWGETGPILEAKVSFRSGFGASWSDLGGLGAVLGASWNGLDLAWGVWDQTWGELGRAEVVLGRPWALSKPLGAISGECTTKQEKPLVFN